MRQILITLFLIVGLLMFNRPIFSQTALSSSDKQEISDNLEILVQSVNTGEITNFNLIISPQNQTLLTEITDQIGNGIIYQLDYKPLDKNITMLGTDQVKVQAKYAASGLGWNVSGLSTYFIFEKQNNNWLITDTDFHQKIGPEYVFSILSKVFIIAGPIYIVFFAFWLWMLIDCVKREFDDKTVWIILLIFLNFIAAIIYYFLIKRKNVIRKPLIFNINSGNENLTSPSPSDPSSSIVNNEV